MTSPGGPWGPDTVFFGSALTNFGVELFLRDFTGMAPGPASRKASNGHVSPEDRDFRGFIFKIQANMDPNHRDRVAFMRVVSGRFERGMTVTNPRGAKRVRLTRPQKLFGQDREGDGRRISRGHHRADQSGSVRHRGHGVHREPVLFATSRASRRSISPCFGTSRWTSTSSSLRGSSS